jgi:hypothetical protein
MKGFAHAALQFEKASDAPSGNFGGRPATPDAAIFAQCWNLASGVYQAVAERRSPPKALIKPALAIMMFGASIDDWRFNRLLIHSAC